LRHVYYPLWDAELFVNNTSVILSETIKYDGFTNFEFV